MDDLAYKPGWQEVVARLRTFYVERPQDRVLARFEVPSAVLREFRREQPEGFCRYPDPEARIAFWDRLLRERLPVEDDSLPSAYLSEMDQGLYGGLVGGTVEFMAHENGWVSSMVAPVLEDWSGFDRLRLDPGHPWFRRYLRQLNVFAGRARGKFGLSHFILIDGLNFVFELVGATETYVSLLERPDMVRRAIAFAFDLNVAVQRAFFAGAPELAGGTFSNMGQWFPGRIVSESVDPFHMTGPEYFEAWGRANVERMFAEFDGGVLHIHGNGRHLLPVVSTVPGLKGILLGDDKGFPPAYDVLGDLKRRVGDVPLFVTVDYERFRGDLKSGRLVGGVFYQVAGAPDAAAANRCMERVRAYRG